MKVHLFLSIIISSLISSVKAQPYIEKYFGITGRNIAASYFQIFPDGGYFLSGSLDGEGSLIRTNSIGDTIWTRFYPDATADYVTCLIRSKGLNVCTNECIRN